MAIANARYVLNAARHLGDELMVKAAWTIETRARAVLDDALAMLAGIEKTGLMTAIETGAFAGIRRGRDAWRKGLSGVVERRPGLLQPRP